jgi:hypothetical protein
MERIEALRKVSILLAVTVADDRPEIPFLLTAGPHPPMANWVPTPLLFEPSDSIHKTERIAIFQLEFKTIEPELRWPSAYLCP